MLEHRDLPVATVARRWITVARRWIDTLAAAAQYSAEVGPSLTQRVVILFDHATSKHRMLGHQVLPVATVARRWIDTLAPAAQYSA